LNPYNSALLANICNYFCTFACLFKNKNSFRFSQQMKQFSHISTLIFDFGGVLINLDLKRCIQNFKELGLDHFEENLNLYGQKGFFLQFEKGLIGVNEFHEEIRKLSAKPLTNEQIDNAWCTFLCDIPTHKIEMLLELKKKYRLLLLSNTNPIHIEISAANEFSRAGTTISEIFDRCYLSYEMIMVKPNADIFQTLLKTEQVTAGECLFLDDGIKNIEQAANLGFQTYLVKANEDLRWLLDIG